MRIGLLKIRRSETDIGTYSSIERFLVVERQVPSPASLLNLRFSARPLFLPSCRSCSTQDEPSPQKERERRSSKRDGDSFGYSLVTDLHAPREGRRGGEGSSAEAHPATSARRHAERENGTREEREGVQKTEGSREKRERAPAVPATTKKNALLNYRFLCRSLIFNIPMRTKRYQTPPRHRSIRIKMSFRNKLLSSPSQK